MLILGIELVILTVLIVYIVWDKRKRDRRMAEYYITVAEAYKSVEEDTAETYREIAAIRAGQEKD